MSDTTSSLTAVDPTDKYERLLSRFADSDFPPLIIAIGLDEQLLVALDRHAAASHVLAIEPFPSLARRPNHALSRSWIALKKLTVLNGPDYHGHGEAWKLVPHNSAQPPMLVDPRLARDYPADIERAKKVARDIVLGARSNEEARQRFAGPYLLNTIANMPSIAAEANASALQGLFHDIPAIVVGAGPSLDANLPALKTISSRALVIAVDTAVRPLLAAAIRPHLVVSVDPSETNARHLNDLSDTRGLWFVAEGSLASTVFPQFAGRTFIFKVSNHQPWPWLAEHGADRELLRTWGSVLTTAFDIALRVGSNPIVFAGADLAYTGGLQYCRNTAFEPDWSPFPTDAERAAEFAKYLVNRPHLCQPDIQGHDIITTSHFVQFRDWIAAQASAVESRRIINATGGGILLGAHIEQAALTDVELPPIDVADEIQRRLATAWKTTAADSSRVRRALGEALEYGTAVPLADWKMFAGDHVALERVRESAQHTAGRLRTETRKAAFLERQRASYDRRIESWQSACELSHGHFDIAARKAAAQQTHILLDLLQRTYRSDEPDLESVLQAMAGAKRAIRALDVGCGVGRSMEALVDAGVCVDGVDVSERMIEFARTNHKLAESSFFTSAGNDCGDAPDGNYDLTYSLLCFRYIPSRSVRLDLLRAMARALRPGGVVVVEMRYWKNLTAATVPAPHVPWSADAYDVDLDAGLVDVCPTPDELHLIYDDFARFFEDVRLQFVEVPVANRERLPLQLFVSGSVGGGLASRIHAVAAPFREEVGR